MKTKFIYSILALFIFSMSMLFGQDADAAVGAPEVIYENQFLGTVVSIALSALTIGLAWVGRKVTKLFTKWGLEQDAISELETQVSLMYHNEVREVKIALGDNSNSREDALDFRRRVRVNLLSLLKGPVKDFVVDKGKDWVSGKIEDIISAKKRK